MKQRAVSSPANSPCCLAKPKFILKGPNSSGTHVNQSTNTGTQRRGSGRKKQSGHPGLEVKSTLSLRGKRTPGFCRVVENLNSPSQKQQKVQLLKCLSKGKALTTQLLQILKIQVEWFLINQGKRPFPVDKEKYLIKKKRIFRLKKEKC